MLASSSSVVDTLPGTWYSTGTGNVRTVVVYLVYQEVIALIFNNFYRAGNYFFFMLFPPNYFGFLTFSVLTFPFYEKKKRDLSINRGRLIDKRGPFYG